MISLAKLHQKLYLKPNDYENRHKGLIRVICDSYILSDEVKHKRKNLNIATTLLYYNGFLH